MAIEFKQNSERVQAFLLENEGKLLLFFGGLSYLASYVVAQKIFNGTLETNPLDYEAFFALQNLGKFCVWYATKQVVFFGGTAITVGRYDESKARQDLSTIAKVFRAVRKLPYRVSDLWNDPEGSIDRTKEEIKEFATTHKGFIALGMRIGLAGVDFARRYDLVDDSMHFGRRILEKSIHVTRGIYDNSVTTTYSIPRELVAFDYSAHPQGYRRIKIVD